MSFDFDNTNIKKNVFKGFFGIEKESLRVDERGYLSHTRHPFVNNPNIDRDFCENQYKGNLAHRSVIIPLVSSCVPS